MVPDRRGERSAGQRQVEERHRRDARSHVEQDEHLLASQVREAPPGQLGEEDDRDPLGGGSKRLTRNQPHVDRARHHDKGDEKRPDDGSHGEAVFVRPAVEHVCVVVRLRSGRWFGFFKGRTHWNSRSPSRWYLATSSFESTRHINSCLRMVEMKRGTSRRQFWSSPLNRVAVRWYW